MAKLNRNDAVALCEALGYKDAATWKKAEMSSRLEEIAELATDPEGWDIEDERLQKVLAVVVGSGGDVELTVDEETELSEAGGDEAEDGADQSAVEEEPSDDKEAEKVVPSESSEGKKSEKPQKKGKRVDKQKKVSKKRADKSKKVSKKRGSEGPDIGSPKGIRSIRNRLFCAGALLREKGLADGLTEEFIKELDTRFGKSNLQASKSQLGLAWHVVNGYLHGAE